MKKPFYITTPIYYVNAQPHIGHAYTTLAADVLARYQREVKQQPVYFLTGTDEHGKKNAEAAEAAGLEPQAFVDRNSQAFQDMFKQLGIEFDQFIRTTSDQHKQSVTEFMTRLHAAGALYEGIYKGLYCTGCEDFITEKELVNGLCPIHQKAPEVVEEKNWFFKLQDYLGRVEDYITKNNKLIWPEHIRKEVQGLFKQDLPDFSVTRERLTWGIDAPFAPGQKIYVWVEALQNYVSALGFPDGDLMTNWPADAHFIGKDIIKFHCIYWPAMLLAAGLELPKQFVVNGFFTVNGQKMSKTIGNVIDPLAMIKRYGVDGTRYLLLTQFPYGQDGDVKAEKFDEKFNADLANGLGNLTSRVLNLIEKNLDGKRPAKKEVTLEEDIERMIEENRFDRALEIIWELIKQSNEFIEKEKPWELTKTDSKTLEAVLGKLADHLEIIATALVPFMPETSQKILTALSADTIVKGEPLFPRLT